ncbi:hypothetical protein JCM6882_008547 [Rhodosporidiobolus microsporus]
MSETYLDDVDSAISYAGAWAHYSGANGTQDASAWYNQTFSSIAYNNDVTISNATLSFTGTGVSLFSEFSTSQGRFFCFVDDGAYNWYNGGSAAGIGEWRLNVTRCTVNGLSDSPHTITFGQTQGDTGDVGVSLDFAVVESGGSSAGANWTSSFDSASPPADMADTTQASTTATSSSLSPSSTSAPVSTPSFGGGGSNSTALGVGVGVGVGGALALALVAGWWFRRRGRRSKEGSQTDAGTGRLSVNSGSGGGLPFAKSASDGTYPSSPSEYGRQSVFGGTVPEVQEYQASGGSPYLSRPSPAGEELANRAWLTPSPSSQSRPQLLTPSPNSSPSQLLSFAALFPPSFCMGYTYIDDVNGSVSYSGDWVHYNGTEGAINATTWFDETFSSVRSGDSDISTATLSFRGSGVAVFGDYNPNQGRYFCYVDDQEYHWFNGGSAAGVAHWSLNVTRCAVSGLEDAAHTITFGQTREDCDANGSTFDLAVVVDGNPPGTVEWASNFDKANPPAGMADSTKVSTTQAASTSSSTTGPPASSSSATASSTSSTSSSAFSGSSTSAFVTSTRSASSHIPSPTGSAATLSGDGLIIGAAATSSASIGATEKDSSNGEGGSSSSNSLALPVGLGVGLGGAALILGVAVAWYRSRKNRGDLSGGGTSYAPSQGDPDNATIRAARMSTTGVDPRVLSMYASPTPPNPFENPSFIAPAPFDTLHQRSASAMYPEVQEDSHSPVLAYMQSPYPTRQPDGSPSPAPPSHTVPPSLADPHSFHPRH